MVLAASDELRHEWDEDPLWRESWYFNMSDPANEIGMWLYLWVVPNQAEKTGMLVSLYHGVATDQDSNGMAWASPAHLLRGPGGSWVYCYRENVVELTSHDVDEIEVGGMHWQRLSPLDQYRLSFEDGANGSFELDCKFMTRPWDFADNVHETPPWLAKNRYHRGWTATGSITVGGRTYQVDTTGDSDHSWGTRDGGVFGRNNLKTYALQRHDGELSVKAQLLGEPGREVPRGYIAVGTDMQAVRSIEESSRYRPTGEMYDMSLRVEDVAGRVVEAHMDSMYAALSGGGPTVGYEGAGVWDVADWGRCAGLASCWWAAGTTRDQLHSGEAGRTAS